MITINDLHFAYSRRHEELFGGITCTFPAGQVTAITGPSGTGKSTLLYLIGLMLTPTLGQVLWEGQTVSRLSDGERSRLRAARVGFIFQDAALDPSRTVGANMMEGALYAGLHRGIAVGRRKELLDQLGVSLREDHRPGEISGGQAQRVALARALIKQPDIILADEPTGNLDTDAAQVVIDSLLHAKSTGAVVVLATHSEGLVSDADRVLALR